MKKILILLLFSGLFATLFAAQNVWTAADSATNTNWNNNANWSLGTAPGSSDTVTLNATGGSKAPTVNVDVTIKGLNVSATYTRALSFLGYRLTTDFWRDSGNSGTRNWGLQLSINTVGARGLFTASTVGTITATLCTLFVAGNKDTLFYDKAANILRMVIANSDTVIVNGAANPGYVATAGAPITIGTNAYFVNNRNSTIQRNTSGDMYSIGAGGGWGGSGNNNFFLGGNGITVNFPAITYTGTTTQSIISDGNTRSTKILFTGNINWGTRALRIYYQGLSANDSGWIDFNNYNLTCGALVMGTSATPRKVFINWGTGTHTIASYDGTASSTNTGSTFDSLKSCKIICAGNFTMGSNHTVVPGTSKISTTGTCSFTSAGKAVYDLTDSLGALTFADSATINNDFTILSGNSSATTWAGYTMSCGGDVVMDGTGTLNMGTGVTMTGNNALLHVGSGVGTVTATSCAVTFNGTGCTLDVDKGALLKKLVLGSGASVNNIGTPGTATFTDINAPLVFTNGGTLTTTRRISLRLAGSGSFISVLAGTPVWFQNDSTSCYFSASTNNIKCTIPAFTFSGTWGVTLSDQAFTNVTFDLAGNLIMGRTYADIYISTTATTGTFTFNTNNYSMLGSVQFDPNSASGTPTANFNLGSSTITAGVLISVNKACTINLGSSVISIDTLLEFSALSTIIPGTSIISAIKEGYFSTRGKALYTLKCAMSNTSSLTISDSVVATNFYLDSGIVVGNAPFRLTNLYANKDSNYLGTGVLTIDDSGSINIKSGCALKLESTADKTGSLGKLIRFLSSVSGIAARLWAGTFSASYNYFKDINSGNTITATDGTNVDGTGNTNINFGVVDTIPIIIAITPTSSGVVGGDSATITLSVVGGQNLDTVYFGNVLTTEINGYKVKIPSNDPGLKNIIVVNSAGRDTLLNSFIYGNIPLIDSLRPIWQKRGLLFKVRGSRFGDLQGTGKLYLGTSDLLTTAIWNDTLIIDTIPASWSPRGTYRVIVQNSDNMRDTTQIQVLIPSITPTLTQIRP